MQFEYIWGGLRGLILRKKKSWLTWVIFGYRIVFYIFNVYYYIFILFV